jgi:hypothetical protein
MNFISQRTSWPCLAAAGINKKAEPMARFGRRKLKSIEIYDTIRF